MNSHQIDYKIIGEDIQLVEIELDPMETVIAEAGARVWLQSMPIRKLIQALSPWGRNSGKENQSILGNFLQR